jgi:hypothetical protein
MSTKHTYIYKLMSRQENRNNSYRNVSVKPLNFPENKIPNVFFVRVTGSNTVKKVKEDITKTFLNKESIKIELEYEDKQGNVYKTEDSNTLWDLKLPEINRFLIRPVTC